MSRHHHSHRKKEVICFVCKMPILPHEKGIVWRGGNGWDDLVCEKAEEEILRRRLASTGRDPVTRITTEGRLSQLREAAGVQQQETQPQRKKASFLGMLQELTSSRSNRAKQQDLKAAQPTSSKDAPVDLAKNLPGIKLDSPKKTGSPSKSEKKKESALSELRSDMAKLWSSRKGAEKSPKKPEPVETSRDWTELQTPKKEPRAMVSLSPPKWHKRHWHRQTKSQEEEDTTVEPVASTSSEAKRPADVLKPDPRLESTAGAAEPTDSMLQELGARSMSPPQERLKSEALREVPPNARIYAPPALLEPQGIKWQSATEEILLSSGFRWQPTEEEEPRDRKAVQQLRSDHYSRKARQRDSSVQILDGTLKTMTVEVSKPYYRSVRTEKLPLYHNDNCHEVCLKCRSCKIDLSRNNLKKAHRFQDDILCDLHFSDFTLMAVSEEYMQVLRSFKIHSLGWAIARRKSSTTLVFPIPLQACAEGACKEYPHNIDPNPGYWIECPSHRVLVAKPKHDSDDSDRKSHKKKKKDKRKHHHSRHRHTHREAEDEPPEYIGSARRRTSSRRDKHKVPEAEEDSEDSSPPRRKTPIEERWEAHESFELTPMDQEIYEKYFYKREHWNYYTNDGDLGPVFMSLKQENIAGKEYFRIIVRAVFHNVHGLVSVSNLYADRYNRDDVVRSIGKEIDLNPPLILATMPNTPDELMKLDQAFIKSELKIGVIYVKEGQTKEEEIFDNNETSPLFEEFLELLGDKVRLKGFNKYKGGLDTVNDLTGLHSIFTTFKDIEIMFHVSTMLPYEEQDPQKLQRKRHIGNDIVCIVFLEADNTSFNPICIKSHFLHTFIIVRTSPNNRQTPTRYEVGVVARDEVSSFKPYLYEQHKFKNGPMFREWLLTKVVNGERASYLAPKFARMQDRTRSQMMEDLLLNQNNFRATGQVPTPYRRGSWRPLGHIRSDATFPDTLVKRFEDIDTLADDFARVFLNNEENIAVNRELFNVTFIVGQTERPMELYGVRAILAVRSPVFQEMLFGVTTVFGHQQHLSLSRVLTRNIPEITSPRPRRSNFLEVPSIEAPRPRTVPCSPVMRRAFSRFEDITELGFDHRQLTQLAIEYKDKSSSTQDSTSKDDKDGMDKDKKKDKDKDKGRSSPPTVEMEPIKIDPMIVAQTEFNITEFEPETMRILLDYLHTGSCRLSCKVIPALMCAAEHFEVPDLLEACFHHAKRNLNPDNVCYMLSVLENYSWRYSSAAEMTNMILFYIEPNARKVLVSPLFSHLSESMVETIMCRNLEIPEIGKFIAMVAWTKKKISTNPDPNLDSRIEFKTIMGRLGRLLKLYRIPPHELVNVVLPSRAIPPERVLETLLFQGKSGMYKVEDSYITECHIRIQRGDCPSPKRKSSDSSSPKRKSSDNSSPKP